MTQLALTAIATRSGAHQVGEVRSSSHELFSIRRPGARRQCRQRCDDRQWRPSWCSRPPSKPTVLVISALLLAVLGSRVRSTSAAMVQIDVQPKRVFVNYGDTSDEITCTYTLQREDILHGGLSIDGRREAQPENGKEVQTVSDDEAANSIGLNGSLDTMDTDDSDPTTDSPDEMADPGDVTSKRVHEVDAETTSTTTTTTSRPKIVAARFDSVPSSINLKLYDYNIEQYIKIRSENFRVLRNHSLQLTFRLKNVKQSGKFGCEISSTEVSPARAMMQVYVRTTDRCGYSSGECTSRSPTTMCVDRRECVCLSSMQRRQGSDRDGMECRPVVRAISCFDQSTSKDRRCTYTRKFAVESYEKADPSRHSRFNMSTVVYVDGEHYISEGVERNCYVCTDADPSSRFMTALIVTFLVLVSGAMSVVGAAILYDWWKRRRDLTELEREHTDRNTSAVEAEATRWAAEDRPPSYLETRQSDLHLAGAPPPSYEDVCKAAAVSDGDVRAPIIPRTSSYDRILGPGRLPRQSRRLEHAVSASPLACAPTSSVQELETIHERRTSL